LRCSKYKESVDQVGDAWYVVINVHTKADIFTNKKLLSDKSLNTLVGKVLMDITKNDTCLVSVVLRGVVTYEV